MRRKAPQSFDMLICQRSMIYRWLVINYICLNIKLQKANIAKEVIFLLDSFVSFGCLFQQTYDIEPIILKMFNVQNRCNK